MTDVIKKLFTNPAAIKSEISYYTCTLKVFPGWLDCVERHKILVWLILFLLSITTFCFTVFVGYNNYTRLVSLNITERVVCMGDSVYM